MTSVIRLATARRLGTMSLAGLLAGSLVVPAGAETVHFTFGLSRDVEACWEQDGVLHYRADGDVYRVALKDVARIDGNCGEGPRPTSKSAPALESLPEPGPTDARLSAGVVTPPPVTWSPPGVPGSARKFTPVTVTRVFDADTIEARFPDGHLEVIRYVGINGPELHRPERGEDLGARAAWAANRALLDRRRVDVSFDAKTRDRFGRLLAYVWVDGIHVNAELVRRGHAVTVDYPEPVLYANRFRDLEREAREARRALWAEEASAEVRHDLANSPEAQIVVSDAPPGSRWISPGLGSRPGPIRIFIIRGR